MRQSLQIRESHWLIPAVWLAYSVWITAMTVYAGGPLLGTDDAMRLAEVRDLLNGQSWYDTTQWRMNTPYGLPMHWSRLIDVGIAAVYLVLRTGLSASAAETVTLYVWPMLPFLALLVALYRITCRLSSELAPLLVLTLAVACAAIRADFSPGTIDHHNVQLALMAWTLAFLMDSTTTPRSAAYAAIAAAASLTVGIEVLPYIIVAAMALAALWIFKGENWGPQVRFFGGTFAAASTAFLLLFVAARYRFAPSCDTYSSIYAAVAILGGAGLASMTFFARALHTPLARAVAFGALLGGLGAVAYFIDPNCLRGPYSEIDPQLTTAWISRVNEAQSALALARVAPGEFVAAYGYAVMGLIAAFALFIARKEDRSATAFLCAFVVVGVVVAYFQIRAARFAIVFSLPAIAWVLRLVFRSPKLKGLAAPIAGTFALALSTDAAFAVVGRTLIEPTSHVAARTRAFDSSVACFSPEAIEALSRFPTSRIAAFVDQGPAILAYTNHAVIGGPYHRNAQGILDSYTLFSGPLQSAMAVLKRRHIDNVFVCRSSADWSYFLRKSGDRSLVKMLASNSPPSWLRLLTKDESGDLELYAVDKRRLRSQ